MTAVNPLLMLSSNPNLNFVAAPALAPAEVAVDESLMEQYQLELQRVSSSVRVCSRR